MQELFEKSVEITVGALAEGDLSSAVGLFLTNLEKEAGVPIPDQQVSVKDGQPMSDVAFEEKGVVEKTEIFYYDEWDFRAGDYKPRWCRVLQRPLEEGDEEYFEETLRRYSGLAAETRKQFEQLRPVGIGVENFFQEAFGQFRLAHFGDEVGRPGQVGGGAGIGVENRLGRFARGFGCGLRVFLGGTIAFIRIGRGGGDDEGERENQRQEADLSFLDNLHGCVKKKGVSFPASATQYICIAYIFLRETDTPTVNPSSKVFMLSAALVARMRGNGPLRPLKGDEKEKGSGCGFDPQA